MSSVKKNILIVSSEFPPQPGGIGNHAYHLALYLSKENYSVRVIADQRSLTGEEEALFDATLPFAVVRIKRYSLRFRMYLKRLAVTFKCFNDASHVLATGKFSLWNVAFVSLFHKNKTLAIVHGSEVNFNPFLLRHSIDLALKQFDTIVAVSHYTKSLMQHLEREIIVIPNGIQLEQWITHDLEEMPLQGNPVLTTVGRVSSRKGQLNVIKQLPELIKIFPELHYHCVGIPTEADTFLEEAKLLGVETHITFHGSVTDLVLKQILNVTDIFVMLSSESETGDVEGFGIAILEANALGIPAIGSKHCGIEDAIKPNVSGVLIDTGNTKQLIKSIANILQAKDSYKKGSKHWATQHDWSDIIKRYIALLP
ncbi:glycosyltransferase family 4 protein [Gaetbulibacter sp. M235]|uniref:glycosyltransferase family 4 protein n=1 Tax=Gaetbulibacter sp. M235 TaxID=3126510 RepID=UPI00374E330E